MSNDVISIIQHHHDKYKLTLYIMEFIGDPNKAWHVRYKVKGVCQLTLPPTHRQQYTQDRTG